MLLSDLLRHFPELSVLGGQPDRVHVHRVDVLDPGSAPVDGTLYLHADTAGAQTVLEGWRRRYRLEQLGVLTPGQTPTLEVPALEVPFGRAGTVAWLAYPAGTLPIDLSARLLRVLIEQQPRGGSESEQLRDEIVEELLTRPDHQTADILRRALAFGLDLSGMNQVIVVGGRGHERAWPGEGHLLTRQGLFRVIRRAAREAAPLAQVFQTGAQVALLFDGRSDVPERLAQQLAAHLQREFPAHYVLAALGERAPDATLLARSYRTARAALEITLDRPQQARWVSYDGVRHLLLYREMRRNPELTELIEGSLRPLLDLPGEYRRVLLETLAAYLEHNRSPARAAAALGVHPNTLKYRMKRISEFLDLRAMSGGQFVLYYLAAQLNAPDVSG